MHGTLAIQVTLALLLLGCKPAARVHRTPDATTRRPPRRSPPGRLRVTTGARGPARVETVRTPQLTSPAPAKNPALCREAGLGLVPALACKGGGRQLMHGFATGAADRLFPAATRRRLLGLTNTFPDARGSEAFRAAALQTHRTLVRKHLVRMYTDPRVGATRGRRWRTWSDFSHAGLGKLWSELRMEEGLHFNARNGLVLFQVTMRTVSGSDRSYARTMRDFPGTTRRAIDAGRARSLGEALGQVAFAMENTQFKLGEVALLMLGKPLL
jgi:hypothetical protein